MLVSFIIPAYNASKTIIRCLDSIYTLGLSKNEFEVICIDDYSTDDTIVVIKQYAKQHANLTLLCQPENHRQGAARNRGIAIAKGQYIVYVDSDDESDKGVLDALQLAEQNNLEMVAMHYVNIDVSGNSKEKEPISIDGIFTGIELQTIQPYWGTGPVPYLYRTSFINKVNYKFKEDVLYEDSDYVTVHLFHASKMMYCSKCSYKIHYNSKSTIHTISYKHVADYFLLGTRMLKFYHNITEVPYNYSQGILEGGSWNIWKACLMLLKLKSLKDIKMFYSRIDQFINRKDYIKYSEPAYCWGWWTKICIKYKYAAIILASIGQIGYRLFRRLNMLKQKHTQKLKNNGQ